MSKGTLVFSKPSMPKPSSQTPKVVKLLKPYSKTFPSPSRFSMSFIPKISLSTLNYPKALSKSPQFLKKSLNKFRCTCIAVVPQVGLYLSISRRTLFFFSPLGHPKPIPQSHEHIITDIIAIRTNINYVGAPVYAPLPLYHVRAFFHPPKQTKLKKKKKNLLSIPGNRSLLFHPLAYRSRTHPHLCPHQTTSNQYFLSSSLTTSPRCLMLLGSCSRRRCIT